MDVALLNLDQVKYNPKLEDEIGSLGVVLHCFLSNGNHYSLGNTSLTDWDRAKREYEAKSRSARNVELFELKHFPRNYRVPGSVREYTNTYTDGMDFLLMLLHSEGRCSLDEAKQHPLMRTDDEVIKLLGTLFEFFKTSTSKKRLQQRVMQALELFSNGFNKVVNKEVSFVIASFPFGLRQLHAEKGVRGYLALVLGVDAANAQGKVQGFKAQGWSSTLPPEVARSLHGLRRDNDPHNVMRDETDPSTRLSDLAPRDQLPKYLFSVLELLTALWNLSKHLPDVLTRQGTEPKKFVAKLLRRDYPLLLSHVWHVLSYFKDELKQDVPELHGIAF